VEKKGKMWSTGRSKRAKMTFSTEITKESKVDMDLTKLSLRRQGKREDYGK